MAVLAVIGAGSSVLADDKLSLARVLTTPPMPEPGYLEPATDPVFGTPFTRVTDPGRQMAPGLVCGQAYCTHRYSSSQAWNADQSLVLIANGCSGLCFLDGQSYKPLFHRNIPNECEWHPTDPKEMICVNGNEIYLWAPVTEAKTQVFVSNEYKEAEESRNCVIRRSRRLKSCFSKKTMLLKSMIRKNGYHFSEKIMLH